MDFIKQWTYTICITLVISVFFSILTPKGNMGKFYKMILSVFIFLSFIFPFAGNDIDIAFPDIQVQAEEGSQEDTYSALINSNIDDELSSGGYFDCIVDSKIKMNDDEISIQQLTIYIPDSYDKNEVREYVYDKLGIVAEVYHIGE